MSGNSWSFNYYSIEYQASRQEHLDSNLKLKLALNKLQGSTQDLELRVKKWWAQNARRLICSRVSCPFLQKECSLLLQRGRYCCCDTGKTRAYMLLFPGLLVRSQCASGCSRVLPSRRRFSWFSSVAAACFSCSSTPNWNHLLCGPPNHLHKSPNLKLNVILKSLFSLVLGRYFWESKLILSHAMPFPLYLLFCYCFSLLCPARNS